MNQHDLNSASDFWSACVLSGWLAVIWILLYLYDRFWLKDKKDDGDDHTRDY